MKPTLKNYANSITVSCIILLVIISAAGLTFAEGTPQPGQSVLTEMPMAARIASIINMKTEDLIAARYEGKSFVEIAAERGISEEQLINSLKEETIALIEENLRAALNCRASCPFGARLNINRNISLKNMSRNHGAGHRRTGGRHSPRGTHCPFFTGIEKSSDN